MENTNAESNRVNVVLDKKLDSYSWAQKDFIAPQEITVTITIGEYRELVSKVATSDSDISYQKSRVRTAEEERDKALKENSKLKEELYNLQNQLAELRNTLAESGLGDSE